MNNNDVTGRNGDQEDVEVAADDPMYATLLELEALESIAEELAEQGITGMEWVDHTPDNLRERMSEYDIRDVKGLHERIKEMHAEIDQTE